jgi:hypothetical protein
MELVKLSLQPDYFGSCERTMLASGCLRISVFRYGSGVCALRAANAKGEMIVLPYRGQQIWRARFCGRDLTMKSPFDEPRQTTEYLATYGGFLLHCGATAMGVPQVSDTHPLHGELPNIPYDEAYAGIGEDKKGRFLVVGGKVRYSVFFRTDYIAEPEIKLYENATMMEVSLTITNLRSKPMEYMYLCHINFRPYEGARLVYSAITDKEHFKVHFNMADWLPEEQKQALKAYKERIAEKPEIHEIVNSTTQTYDPEIVMTIRYLADASGYAHCMQVMPEGDACYVAFRPEQLPISVRWIARTGDEEAMGMVLPATAEHLGYNHAKANGQIKMIAAKSSIKLTILVGYLEKDRAIEMENVILKDLRTTRKYK